MYDYCSNFILLNWIWVERVTNKRCHNAAGKPNLKYNYLFLITLQILHLIFLKKIKNTPELYKFLKREFDHKKKMGMMGFNS